MNETLNNLLKLRNFNQKSFTDIQEKAKSYGLNFGINIEPFETQSIKDLRIKYQFKPKVNSLEEEINYLINSINNSRNIEIFKLRMGFNLYKEKTLEEVGSIYGMTRERVRQIEKKILLNLKKNNYSSTYIKKVKGYLEKNSPINEIELNDYLVKENFIVPPNTLIKIFDLFKLNSKLKLYSFETHQFTHFKKIRYIALNDYNNDLKKVTNYIIKESSRSGICSINNLQIELNLHLNKKFIKTFISKYIIWLNEDEDWFYFKTKRNRLFNLIAKSFKNVDKVDINFLHKGILKNYRFNRTIPLNIFSEFCNKILGLKLFNNEVYRNELITNFSSNHKSDKFDKILSFFEDYGPILDIEDLYELSIVNDIKKVTLFANLTWSPKFVKIGRAVYALINYQDYNMKDDFLKIELNSLAHKKEDSPPIKSYGSQYRVQILKNGSHFKFTENPRPLRKIKSPDPKSFGVVYKGKVYKVLNPEIIK